MEKWWKNDDDDDDKWRWRILSLITIDDDDDDVKRHWNSDDIQMTIWQLSLMTLPLDRDTLSWNIRPNPEVRKNKTIKSPKNDHNAQCIKNH